MRGIMKNVMSNIGQYAKFVVSAAMAVITGLSPYYGHDSWFPAVSAGIGALLVYLTPNQAKPAS